MPFSTTAFLPHIHCYLGSSSLVWTMASTDLMIGIAYFGISVILVALFRKVRIPFNPVILSFGVFIAACGGTHLLDVWTLWHPDYWWSAGMKVLTAVASIGSGIYLYKLRHPILQVAEATRLAELRQLDLQTLTQSLEKTVAERTTELQAKQAQLTIIADAIPAFIGYIDRDFRFRFMNRYYHDWFGENVHPGEAVSDVLGKEAFENAEPYLCAGFEGHEQQFKTDLHHSRLGLRRILAKYLPDFESPSRVRGIVVLGQDITEQERTEEILKEAVRTRDEFISVASHELKTPLTSMKLQTEMLERKLKKDGIESIQSSSLASSLENSTRQLRRLNALVDDMLDISRISSGKFHVEIAQHDLSELVQKFLARFEEDCKITGCELTSQITSGVVGDFDPFRVEQVLSNLMSNAVKYGEKHPVAVSLRKTTDGDAEIEVTDKGIGIPRDAQKRIFERFERAVDSSSISGMGLGLYIAKKIILAHQGSIHVQSEVGQGATFKVTLPLKAPSRAKDESSRSF